MARYKKGVNTCSYIISVSKKLFYKKGYSQTTIQQICDECNITLGNFTYYFKTKQDLLKRIYEDFLKDIIVFIDNNFKDDLSYLEKFTIISFVFNYKILQSETNLDFHLKVLNNNSLYEFISDYLLSNFYIPLIKSLNLDINEKDLKIIYYCSLSINRELLIKYIKTDMFNSHQDFCLNSSNIVSTLFKFNDNFIVKFIDKYPEFSPKLQAIDLSLLK